MGHPPHHPTSPTRNPSNGTDQNDHTVAMLSWLLTLFFPFFPPLIIYLVTPPDPHTGQRSFANETAREALNWQLTMLIAAVVGVILSIVLIGLLVLAAISVMNLVFCIIGSVKALQGERWTAPMTIKFIN